MVSITLLANTFLQTVNNRSGVTEMTPLFLLLTLFGKGVLFPLFADHAYSPTPIAYPPKYPIF